MCNTDRGVNSVQQWNGWYSPPTVKREVVRKDLETRHREQCCTRKRITAQQWNGKRRRTLRLMARSHTQGGVLCASWYTLIHTGRHTRRGAHPSYTQGGIPTVVHTFHTPRVYPPLYTLLHTQSIPPLYTLLHTSQGTQGGMYTTVNPQGTQGGMYTTVRYPSGYTGRHVHHCEVPLRVHREAYTTVSYLSGYTQGGIPTTAVHPEVYTGRLTHRCTPWGIHLVIRLPRVSLPGLFLVIRLPRASLSWVIPVKKAPESLSFLV